jgi:sterol O-acyltransferase
MFEKSLVGLYSDLSMILSLFYVVLFQKLIKIGLIPLDYAQIFQHIFQTIWFFGFLSWAYLQTWGWTLSGAFTMHVISMLMKQHSYTAYNIDLHHKLIRYERLKSIEGGAKKIDTELYTLDQEEINEMNDLCTELNAGEKMFPANQTLYNFIDYLAVPALVYELHFPRTTRFRLSYFIERVLATFATLGCLYMIVELQINPVILEMKSQTFLDSMVDLMIPFMCCYILLFYIIFECVCNGRMDLIRVC